MKTLFEFKRRPPALLAPLGARRSLAHRLRRAWSDLPPAAAPVIVTFAGGIALAVALAAFLSQQPAPAPQAAQPQPAVAAAEPAPAPQPAAAPVPQPEPRRAATLDLDTPTARFEQAEAEPGAPDAGATASIPRLLPAPAAGPDVPVAESEQELLALEAMQMREVEEDLAVAGEEVAAAAVAMRPATARRYVNMRAGPDDDAPVLGVVPAGAGIEAEADCGWCAVSYQGRSGYIYKSFISYAD